MMKETQYLKKKKKKSQANPWHETRFIVWILDFRWQLERQSQVLHAQEMLAFLPKLTSSTDEEVEVPFSKLL